jgi:transcriptional regulator with XRE-family HTH domain
MATRTEYPAFSRLLRAALEDAKPPRTQTWLAERLGITQQHASDIVNGKHRPPRDKIEAMAELLGLDGDKRQEFLVEAYVTHVPDFIRARLRRLEDQLGEALRASDAASRELADLVVQVTRLQRAAADLTALKSAVASALLKPPERAIPELRALLAALQSASNAPPNRQ